MVVELDMYGLMAIGSLEERLNVILGLRVEDGS